MTGIEMTDNGRTVFLSGSTQASGSTPAEKNLGATVCLSAKQPANHVIAAVLKERLSIVWSLCGEAGDPLAHPEVVHQLRVSTRRSLAALSLFKPSLPRKQRQRFARRLGKLRRAAGTARDLDVIIDRLQQHLPPKANTANALHRLLTLLGDYQVDSRSPLQKWHHKLVTHDWPKQISRLVHTVAKKPKQDRYGTFVSKRLARYGRKFFAATDVSLKRAGDLHQIRIAGKRLRYSLELFPIQHRKKSYRLCCQSLKKMQDALGDFTDHAAAALFFDQLRMGPLPDDLIPLVEELRREELLLADFSQQKFTTWWSEKRKKRMHRYFSKTIGS